MPRTRPALLLLAACAARAPDAPSAPSPPPGGAEPDRIHALDAAGAAGLSGLSTDAAGGLWAVSERPGALHALDPQAHRITRTLPILGLGPGVEPEGVAVAPSGDVWVSTEAPRAGRSGDDIVRIARSGGEARVVERRPLRWADWGLSAPENGGAEGICATDRALLVGGEPVGDVDGRRAAPLAAWVDGGWRPHWALLSSETGKLSGLWCAEAPGGGLDVAFIERHYGVLRLQRAHLPADAAAGSPLIPMDPVALPPAIAALGANFEGLTRHAGEWLLLSDNQSRTISGPTLLVRIPDLSPPG